MGTTLHQLRQIRRQIKLPSMSMLGYRALLRLDPKVLPVKQRVMWHFIYAEYHFEIYNSCKNTQHLHLAYNASQQMYMYSKGNVRLSEKQYTILISCLKQLLYSEVVLGSVVRDALGVYPENKKFRRIHDRLS